jgi:tRNA pseudouridine55 synthase
MNGSGDGILLVSKPAGITSHDVVERVRRGALATGRKVGHAGTLDPFATGLLLVLVGKATRVQRFLMGLPKTYRAEVRFGFTSDTGDPTGQLTETGLRATASAIRAALPSLTGEIEQRVPLTSAVKVGGERLYRKAHRGERFETPSRLIRVSRFELLSVDEADQLATFEIDCSSGTYVRQLAADLGERCGSGAYCERLERLAIGTFRLEGADEGRLIPLHLALDFMPRHELADDEARRARNGVPIPAGDTPSTLGHVRLLHGDELVAVAEPSDGQLKPVTVLASE